MTTTAPDAVAEVLTTVAAARPAVTTIRNAATFGHITRPRRARAAFLIAAKGEGQVEAARFDGRGYVTDRLVGTSDEVTTYVLANL